MLARAMGSTKHGSNLNDTAMLAGWPTPISHASRGNPDPVAFLERKQRTRPGSKALTELNLVAHLTSWPTPTVNDSKGSDYSYGNGDHSKIARKVKAAAAGSQLGHLAHLPVVAGAAQLVGDAQRARLQEQLRERGVLREAGDDGAGEAPGRAGSPTGGLWTDAVWLYCRDGKYRPTQPVPVALPDGAAFCVDYLRPLEVGVEGRVGRIKAYGNAINALQAATFIRAFMEATQHL